MDPGLSSADWEVLEQIVRILRENLHWKTYVLAFSDGKMDQMASRVCRMVTFVHLDQRLFYFYCILHYIEPSKTLIWYIILLLTKDFCSLIFPGLRRHPKLPRMSDFRPRAFITLKV